MFDLCALRGLTTFCVMLDGTPVDTFILFKCYALSTSTQLLTFEGIIVPTSSRSTALTLLGLLDPEDKSLRSFGMSETMYFNRVKFLPYEFKPHKEPRL